MVEYGEDDPVLDEVEVVADGLQEDVEVDEDDLDGSRAEKLVAAVWDQAVQLADDWNRIIMRQKL